MTFIVFRLGTNKEEVKEEGKEVRGAEEEEVEGKEFLKRKYVKGKCIIEIKSMSLLTSCSNYIAGSMFQLIITVYFLNILLYVLDYNFKKRTNSSY